MIKREKIAIGSSGSNPLNFIPIPIVTIIEYSLQLINDHRKEESFKKDMAAKYSAMHGLLTRSKNKIHNIVINM